VETLARSYPNRRPLDIIGTIKSGEAAVFEFTKRQIWAITIGVIVIGGLAIWGIAVSVVYFLQDPNDPRNPRPRANNVLSGYSPSN
jgi:hypothetical protein